MSNLAIKDSALKYFNPGEEKANYVFAHDQITDLEYLASETIPAGYDYEVISQVQAYQEMNTSTDPVHEVAMPDRIPRSVIAQPVNLMGFFGNVWMRSNFLEKTGDYTNGHKHHFDHVSMLISGKVQVEVEGFEPTEFTAPTFIVIKKELQHKFTALEDNSAWFCVFALRDVDGNVTDIYSGDNSPYGRVASGDMNILQNTNIE